MGRSLALVGVLSLAGCLSPTEVLVVLDSDAPSDRLLRITASVFRGADTARTVETHTWSRLAGPPLGSDAGVFDGSVRAFDASVAPALPSDAGVALTLPASFAVVPGAGRPLDDAFTVVLEALLAPDALGSAQVRFRRTSALRFTPHTSTTVTLFLRMACGLPATDCSSTSAPCTVALRCEEQGLTCGDRGVCAPREMATVPLEPDAGRTPSDASVEASAPACPSGCCGTLCSGSCVDTSGNVNHCGACNRSCAAGEDCTGGACVPVHTSGCGACPMGTTCVGSSCRASCAGTRSSCGAPGACVACGGAQVCSGQSCVDGAGACAGTSASCGPSGACVACAMGSSCVGTSCRANCANTRSSCGTPGFCAACSPTQTCVSQSCVDVCDGTTTSCGAPGACARCGTNQVCSSQRCVTVSPCAGSNASCGSPGACVACAAGTTCVSQSCRTNCAGTRSSCGSPGFCVACSPVETCVGGACQ